MSSARLDVTLVFSIPTTWLELVVILTGCIDFRMTLVIGPECTDSAVLFCVWQLRFEYINSSKTRQIMFGFLPLRHKLDGIVLT